MYFQTVTADSVPFKVLELTDPTDKLLTDHGTTDVSYYVSLHDLKLNFILKGQCEFIDNLGLLKVE